MSVLIPFASFDSITFTLEPTATVGSTVVFTGFESRSNERVFFPTRTGCTLRARSGVRRDVNVRVGGPILCQISKVHLVEPHSVPLPGEAALELRPGRRWRLRGRRGFQLVVQSITARSIPGAERRSAPSRKAPPPLRGSRGRRACASSRVRPRPSRPPRRPSARARTGPPGRRARACGRR